MPLKFLVTMRRVSADALSRAIAMRRWRLSKYGCSAALALVAAVLFFSTTLAQEPGSVAGQFQVGRPTIQQQVRGRKKETRLAAGKKLETYPTPEAAKLLLTQGLSSSDDEIRRTAFDVL